MALAGATALNIDDYLALTGKGFDFYLSVSDLIRFLADLSEKLF